MKFDFEKRVKNQVACKLIGVSVIIGLLIGVVIAWTVTIDLIMRKRV